MLIVGGRRRVKGKGPGARGGKKGSRPPRGSGTLSGDMVAERKTLAYVLLLLAVCLPPCLVRLSLTEPARIMENLSVLSSQETWLRLHAGERDAWLVPSHNGRPRIHKPPLLVWANLLAWRGLEPGTATLTGLVGRARRLGVGFALLALLGTYRAGRALAGERTGRLAALATGTMFLFIRQARYATYDIHLLGWVTIAVAAGIEAMRAPPRPGRRAAAWFVSGVALGAALLSKGPLALALGAGPLAAIALADPARRARGLAGTACALAVALAVAAPWYVYVVRHVPGAGARLLVEYRAARDTFQPPWYYLGVVGLVFPWSAWLAGGTSLAAPRGPSGRRRLAPEWAWLLVVFVGMSLPMAKQQRYIMPLLPPAGIIVARALDGGLRGRLAGAVRGTHGVLLALGSVLFPLFLLLQPRLLAAGRIARPEMPGIPPAVPWLLFGLLPVTAWAGYRAHRAGDARRAAWLTALWMAVVATVGYYGYAQSDHGRFRWAEEVRRADRAVGAVPFRYLDRGLDIDVQPSKEFLLYTRRTVPAVGPGELAALLDRGEAFFLAVRVQGEEPTAPPDVRLAARGRFADGEKAGGRRVDWMLYASPAAEAP